MRIPLIASAILTVIGILAAVFLWDRPRARNTILAIVILGVLGVFIGWITSIPIMVVEGYQYLTVQLKDKLGLARSIAQAIAALAAVPFAYALFQLIWPSKWLKRWGGRWTAAGFLAVMYAALLYLGYRRHELPQAGKPFGMTTPSVGVVQLPEYRAKVCDTPGSPDPDTGYPCHALHPAMLQFIDLTKARAKEGVSVLIEDSKGEWYGPDGKPKVWVCAPRGGDFKFVSTPHWIEPSTGKPCGPINEYWIGRYEERKRQRAEREAEAQKQAEATKRQEEQQRRAARTNADRERSAAWERSRYADKFSVTFKNCVGYANGYAEEDDFYVSCGACGRKGAEIRASEIRESRGFDILDLTVAWQERTYTKRIRLPKPPVATPCEFSIDLGQQELALLRAL